MALDVSSAGKSCHGFFGQTSSHRLRAVGDRELARPPLGARATARSGGYTLSAAPVGSSRPADRFCSLRRSHSLSGA